MLISVEKSASSETDEDEFFDCDDQDATGSSSRDEGDGKKQQKSDLPIWSQKAEGREKRMGTTRLLKQDDFLYIPVCQVSLIELHNFGVFRKKPRNVFFRSRRR